MGKNLGGKQALLEGQANDCRIAVVRIQALTRWIANSSAAIAASDKELNLL
jgi:hypothetical protein